MLGRAYNLVSTTHDEMNYMNISLVIMAVNAKLSLKLTMNNLLLFSNKFLLRNLKHMSHGALT